ncbi:Beta-galactosidase [Tolypocladium paradoxum]|uniref:Beta-galactosidase n=1 Tax=Tolypocladium paradoxum TaxID=94208 RepID=A0A2S4LBG5_9HYPO|nr:Beta-galactosidase [Tolypocladium paradoxum]
MLLRGAAAGLAALVSVFAPLASANPMANKGNFTYNDKHFLLNGEPFQIIGGQMDPQRIPKEYWRQRLQMARAMGLNTIFSYIFWNNLESSPGQWNFRDRNDVAQFFRIAQEEGLHVVLRPGPDICGEREWGGFPAWLSQIAGMKVRENNGPFLNATKDYLDRLGADLRRLQVTNGGPILMAQLENEYGSFGKDKTYLQAMADMLRHNFNIFLYTNDGGGKSYLEGGQLHGVLAETDGDPRIGFAARDKYVTDPTSLGPQLDGEYYITWIDDWSSNSAHHITSGNQAAMERVVDDLDIYMFHGGTNWGFENSAIWANDRAMAVTSSYDYGAPLDESGRPTEVYHKLRDMISKHVPAGSIPDIPQAPSLAEVQEFSLEPTLTLFETRSAQPDTQSAQPVTMESLGQSYGFILYEHKVTKAAGGVLTLGDGPRDRVIVYVNGAKVGVIDRTYVSPGSVQASLEEGDLVQLLVENIGRVDYSYKLKEQQKGIVGNVTVGQGNVLEGWSTYSLPLSALPSGLSGGKKVTPKDNDPPVFYTGSFKLPSGAKSDLSGDTFLALPKGIKGQVWVNGINLGRYWTVGPQQSLYVPGCYIKAHGRSSDIVVLELEPRADTQLTGKGIATREWGNNPDPDAP